MVMRSPLDRHDDSEFPAASTSPAGGAPDSGTPPAGDAASATSTATDAAAESSSPGPAEPAEQMWLFEGRRTRRDGTRRAFRTIKAQHSVVLTPLERAAHRLTLWASSTRFLALHVAWFGAWIVWNTGLLPLRPFDPFPFGLLTMIVSLEAIFLSLFVLISQSRESAIAELREEVTLAVNLRVEEEVTKVLQLVSGLYTRLGYTMSEDAALDEMLQPLDADEIEREMTEQIAACVPGARDRA